MVNRWSGQIGRIVCRVWSISDVSATGSAMGSGYVVSIGNDRVTGQVWIVKGFRSGR